MEQTEILLRMLYWRNMHSADGIHFASLFVESNRIGVHNNCSIASSLSRFP